jgi:caffeoyl-CoA O-methyltransferase
MEILDPNLQAYLDAHLDPESEELKINRDTYLKVLKPQYAFGTLPGPGTEHAQ